MLVVIVDTSVWIDALRGTANRHTIWLKGSVSRRDIGLTSLVLCEVLQGVVPESDFRGFRKDLLQFTVFKTDGIELVIQSAQNYRVLRQKGYTVRKTINCIIATFCIENGYELLHNDRDFDAFERYLGLQVVEP